MERCDQVSRAVKKERLISEQFFLDRAYHDRLQVLAKTKGLAVSAVCRSIVKQYLDEQEEVVARGESPKYSL